MSPKTTSPRKLFVRRRNLVDRARVGEPMPELEGVPDGIYFWTEDGRPLSIGFTLVCVNRSLRYIRKSGLGSQMAKYARSDAQQQARDIYLGALIGGTELALIDLDLEQNRDLWRKVTKAVMRVGVYW